MLLVAAVTLNVFNKHCDRVKMACIAQLINVLQSVILTEGEKMILTPTYHIFHMYKYHQDAELLRSDLTGVDTIQNGEFSIPALQESRIRAERWHDHGYVGESVRRAELSCGNRADGKEEPHCFCKDPDRRNECA